MKIGKLGAITVIAVIVRFTGDVSAQTGLSVVSG